MYWILLVMGGFVAVAVALLVGGLATPRRHAVARAVVVRAAPESVWPLVRDVTGYPSWRPGLRSVEIEEGTAGLEWTESTGRSTMRLGLVRDEPPVRFGARVLDQDLPPNTWLWNLEPAGDARGDATRVRLTQHGEVANPIARLVGSTSRARAIDTALRALAARFGDPAPRIEDAAPEPAPAR